MKMKNFLLREISRRETKFKISRFAKHGEARQNSSGALPMIVLLFGSLAVIILTGFIIWADANLRVARRSYNRAQAFRIAEAGIDYYRWHLAHASADYEDGTGGPGPYVHDYYDRTGEIIGQFSLDITPPLIGSSVVTVRSTGKVNVDLTIEKIVEVKLAKPSFAKYSVLTNAPAIRFGAGTEVFGSIHSNGGIRFDGLAHNLVTSALTSYDDPDHSGDNEFAVHTHVSPQDPLPPNSVPVRDDVFQVGRQFPVPAVDFAGLTQNLADIKTQAQASGFYSGASGAQGYEIIFKTDDTFDLYRVNSLVSSPSSNCTNSQYQATDQSGWGTWSVNSRTLLGNYPIPQNGLVFLEDNVWTGGQIDSARVTVASGRFPDNPSTRSNITVNENLLYTNYDGTDTISLIAQNNLNIGMVSTTTLRIDGAILAQNGRVGRYYYNSYCSPYHIRNIITSYGMIGTSQRYGFAYTNGTGYQTRNLIYDSNLLYAPPPSFPLTSDNYEQIFWNEIK